MFNACMNEQREEEGRRFRANLHRAVSLRRVSADFALINPTSENGATS